MSFNVLWSFQLDHQVEERTLSLQSEAYQQRYLLITLGLFRATCVLEFGSMFDCFFGYETYFVSFLNWHCVCSF